MEEGSRRSVFRRRRAPRDPEKGIVHTPELSQNIHTSGGVRQGGYRQRCLTPVRYYRLQFCCRRCAPEEKRQLRKNRLRGRMSTVLP